MILCSCTEDFSNNWGGSEVGFWRICVCTVCAIGEWGLKTCLFCVRTYYMNEPPVKILSFQPYVSKLKFWFYGMSLVIRLITLSTSILGVLDAIEYIASPTSEIYLEVFVLKTVLLMMLFVVSLSFENSCSNASCWCCVKIKKQKAVSWWRLYQS